MKELCVSAGGLLAPGHSAIGGPEDQPIVSNDIAVIFVHELDRIEIGGSITLSATAGAIQILHKGAAPVLAEKHCSGVADDPHTVSKHEDVVEAGVDSGINLPEGVAVVVRLQSDPVSPDDPDLVAIVVESIKGNWLVPLLDGVNLGPALLA